jgi:hypothetical protein
MGRSKLLIAILLVCVVSSGCVRRRLTIRSNPLGAKVYIDDQQIGTTPVSTSFLYYGTRKIQLVKDGYATLTVKQKFSPPWYQVPPLDFVTENLVPHELRDERIVEFELEPQPIVPTAELMERAEQLRDSTRSGYSVPVPRLPAASATMDAPAGVDRPQAPPPFYPAGARPR